MKQVIDFYREINQAKNFEELYSSVPKDLDNVIAQYIVNMVMIIPILTMGITYLFNTDGNNFMYLSYLLLGYLGVIVLFWCLSRLMQSSQKQLLIRKNKVYRYNCYLLLFLLSAVISLFNTNNIAIALIGTSYRHEGLFTYIAYAGFYSLGVFILNENYRKKSLYYFIIVSSIVSIFAIVHYTIVNLYVFHKSNMGFSAIFFQFNHFGYYLLMTGMCAAVLFLIEKNKKLKVLSLCAFCVIGITLVLNDTFGCYLAMLFGLIFTVFVFSFSKGKFEFKYLVPFFIFVFLSFGVNMVNGNLAGNLKTFDSDIRNVLTDWENSGGAGTGRWVLWTNAVEFIKEKPWFGHGLDNLGYLYEPLNVGTDRPHNEYLQHAAQLGIPALIFYICALASIYIKAFINRKTLSPTTLVALCAVGAYLFSALFGNTMFYTTPYFLMLLGMATKIGNDEENMA